MKDLQLMELATRTFPRRLVNGLGKCIEHDAPMTFSERAKWKACKDGERKPFAPGCGGSYEIFIIHALTPKRNHAVLRPERPGFAKIMA